MAYSNVTLPPLPDYNKKFCSYNGHVLPPLPDYDTAAYPYAFISQNAAKTAYVLALTATRPVYGPDPQDSTVNSVYSEGLYYSCLTSSDEASWMLYDPINGLIHVTETAGTVIWTNTDILSSDSVYLAASEPVEVDTYTYPYSVIALSYEKDQDDWFQAKLYYSATPFTWNGSAVVNSGTTVHMQVYDPNAEQDDTTNTQGIYGVKWDYTNSSTKLTRLNDAANFDDPVPATSLTESGSSPFDNIAPWSGMKLYNVIDGEVTYSVDSSDFSMTDYDTVVYIPEFYYKVEQDSANGTIAWYVTSTATDGFSLHPGSGRYIGRYHTSSLNSVYCSRSGQSPVVKIYRPTARTNSHNKGDSWWMMDLATWSAIQLLYLVEFADWDSQTVLGGGQNSGSVKTSGGTDGAVYHTLKRSSASNQYRWIEDPYSNVRDWVDGIVLSSRVAYIGTTNENFGDTTSGLTSSGITIPSSDGFISMLGVSTSYPWAFLPKSATGSESTYVPDKVYVASDDKVLCVGGYYGSHSAYGLFCFGANGSALSGMSDLGSRLLYIP